ncbi:MAG: carbohydrate binding family 9 domain-containing protein [bacterium]|nr:carbohydrate binding family 9 domain-containing protein [bacterium]
MAAIPLTAPSVTVRARLCALLALLVPVIPAAAADFTPVFRPTMEISRAAGEIDVDGRLDDAGWRGAAGTDRFVERQPGDNVAPPVRTEAFLAYDDDNLYAAFVCDDDPAALRATMCQRDQYGDDDAVGIFLDTFGEASWAYEFFVNPYGIQKDLMWTSVHGEDSGFDVVWHSAARVTDTGYVVEMAIPMSALRFPVAEVQSWRLDLWRLHPRESSHQYSWAAYDRDEQCFPCQWGTVGGIRGVRPGKGFELLPSYIAYRTGRTTDHLDPDARFDDHDIKGEPSFGAKYAVSSDVTVEASLNPDFSQIEADADQIDVNTTIVQRYPERRPFFQEGSDLFRTLFNSFYTRMVNAPELAAKGTARWERTSLAFVLARDEHSPYIIPTEERSYRAPQGKSTVNVLRGLQSFGAGSQAGLMATDRRYDDGGSGTILSGDFNLRLSSRFSWVGQVVYSHTEEPDGIAVSPGETFDHGRRTVDLDGESYAGTAFITELRRRSRDWNVTLDYNQLDPTYRTQTGYDPWTDQRNAFVYTNYNFWFEDGLFTRITPGVFADGRWNMDGRRKWQHANAQVDFNLRWAQTHVGIGGNVGREMWGGVAFDDLWNVTASIDGRPHDVLGYYASYSFGRNPAFDTLGLGDERSLSLALELKPVDRLIVEPTLEHVRSEDATTGDLLFRQSIARARLRLQVNPRLSLRLVVQHNDSESPLYRELAQAGDFPDYHMYFGSKWEVDPLLTYRVNSFSVFYLGSTHDYRDYDAARDDAPSNLVLTERQYFTKLQYLFQL